VLVRTFRGRGKSAKSCFFLGQGNKGNETALCVGALGSAFLPKYNSVERIKNNGTGGTCSALGGEESCIQNFGGES